MEYLDERTISFPTCSKDELRKQIEEIEIKNFGHTTSKNTAADSSGTEEVFEGFDRNVRGFIGGIGNEWIIKG